MAKRGTKPGDKIVTRQMRFDILHSLRERGYDPLERLLKYCDEAEELYQMTLREMPNNHWVINSRWQMRSQVAAELLKYVYPQRKAIEHTGENGEGLFKSFADAVKTVRSEIEAEHNTLAIELKAKDVTNTDGT